jgi:hypothetical protein
MPLPLRWNEPASKWLEKANRRPDAFSDNYVTNPLPTAKTVYVLLSLPD